MNKLEDRVDEIEDENQDLSDKLSDLEGRFEAFAKHCAIGSEQLWELVCEHLNMPVPAGVDLRDMI